MKDVVLLSFHGRRWLASAARTAYLRLGLVQSTTASIKAEAIRVNPEKRRNPVALALDWQQCLDCGEFSSRAELARQLGVTRAHVTQVLSLLHLAPDARSLILTLGDPIKGKGFGIHTLRSLLHLPGDEQISRDQGNAESENLRSV